MDGGSLWIHNISFANAGDYECIVHTVVGHIESRSTVRVEGPPSSPGRNCLIGSTILFIKIYKRPNSPQMKLFLSMSFVGFHRILYFFLNFFDIKLSEAKSSELNRVILGKAEYGEAVLRGIASCV